MGMRLKVLGCLCVTLFLSVTSDAKDWRGIVPFHSTRADVEGLLGEPPPPPKDGTRFYVLNKGRSIYFLDEGEVYIVYANEEVPAAVDCLRTIPIDTVLLIQVTPQAETRLSDLPIDEKRFRRFDPAEPSGMGFEGYVDEEDGIVIRTFKGRVEQINYVAAKNDRRLCPGYLEKPEDSIRVRAHFHSKMVEYGNIRFRDEKAQLDNFAIALQKAPEMKGYIIAYGGRRARVGVAQERAERAKKYLVQRRQIDAGRVVIIDGGYREELTVELHIVNDDGRPPTVVPTVDPDEVEVIFEEQNPRQRRRQAKP